ncbi:hypothetical protein MUK42_11589 [Musa troglodytarum]|uniref:Uncharacterized protein n=1 Tax=Musa troglodytarum TaxID=320322 RepID=A0A9E7I2D8_9LILI|nr:hypothetical protein MUK42_11589 [Musa troglodytarum]
MNSIGDRFDFPGLACICRNLDGAFIEWNVDKDLWVAVLDGFPKLKTDDDSKSKLARNLGRLYFFGLSLQEQMR